MPVNETTVTNPDDEPDTNLVAIPANFEGVLGRADRPMVCSFNLKTPEGRDLLQRCEEAPDAQIRSIVGEVFEIRHVYAKVVDKVDEQTGEAFPILRICLINPQGLIVACASDGIRESIVRLMRGHGLPPWKDAIRVTFKQRATRGPRVRLYLLEHIEKPEPSSAEQTGQGN